MIRFCSLGSGSSGNATVVEATSGITTTRLLVDAGFSLRELETRLTRAGLAIADLDAVFVTHEHNDHIGCAMSLAERHGLALFMSRGTWRAIGRPVASLEISRAWLVDPLAGREGPGEIVVRDGELIGVTWLTGAAAAGIDARRRITGAHDARLWARLARAASATVSRRSLAVSTRPSLLVTM